MDNIKVFSEIEFPYKRDSKVIDWNQIKINDDVRIFYLPANENGKLGFDFYVTEFHSVPYRPFDKKYEDDYDDPSLCVECLFWGTAYSDGLRHLSMGDEQTENEGYLYYVGPWLIAKIFQEIHELELKYCDTDR